MKKGKSIQTEKSAISWWEDLLSGFIERHKGFFRFIGNLETWAVSNEVAELIIDRPVYICGLPRAGSTILLELLASQQEMVTHQYRDFPFVYIPVLWNWFVDRASHGEIDAVERFHKDRILVTAESPEAMEEIIWMAFFPNCHDSSQSNVLGEGICNPMFEKFYKDHIRKLIFVRGGYRYAAKGNYNFTRIQYLKKLFPDARFVIPVRDPVSHVASLMKQHRLFCVEEKRDRRILDHMRRSGHYEFGLDLRPINVGNLELVERFKRLWNEGEEAKGWACYWASVYGFVADMLDTDTEIRQATIVIYYDDLCRNPLENLARIYDHCEIKIDEESLHKQAGHLSLPSYYATPFSEDDKAIIKAETNQIEERIRQFCGKSTT